MAGRPTELVNDHAEERLLGCILAKPELYAEIAQSVGVSHFSRLENRLIWTALNKLHEINAVALCDHLLRQNRLDDAGGPLRIAGLTTHVASPDNDSRAAVAALSEHVTLRRLQGVASRINQSLVEGRASSDILTDLSGQISALAHTTDDEDDNASAQAIGRRIATLLELGPEARYRTGISGVDALMGGGFTPGIHTILGAMSGHGKTTMTSAIVAGLLCQNPDLIVDWYSCEVPDYLQLQRIASAAFGVDERYWRNRDAYKSASAHAQAVKAQRWMFEIKDRLRIYQSGAIDVRRVQLKAAARRARNPSAPYVVVVDYIQRANYGNRSTSDIERIAAASQAIAGIALDYDAMTIALSQFTTDVPTEPVRIPNPMQARWSKEILNDAADFLIYHRPYPYSSNATDRSICLLQRSKSRYGIVRHTWMQGNAANQFERTDQRVMNIGTAGEDV